MEQCPKCGAPVNPGQKFCTKCGQPLNKIESTQTHTTDVCQNCGAPLTSGQKFCTKCGTKVSTQPTVVKSEMDSANKGFINNVSHLGTFLRQGSQGVDRQMRREQEAQLRQQAQAMGLEVNKPQSGNSQAQSTSNQVQQSRQLVVDNTSVEGINLVSGRAIWDIKKGEVGRLVTEAEFANANGLKGVIVQEGCTAMVFIDGVFISTIQAGVYTFPAKTEAERMLNIRQRELEEEAKNQEKERRALEAEQRKKDEEEANTFASRGVFGEIAAFGQGVMNFLFGKKKEDTAQQHQQRIERTRQRLNSIASPKICRVYIVSNRLINLIFSSQETAEGSIDFAPITIPTKLMDVSIAVSMQLEISNMQEFVKNYLADRKSISALDLQQMLMPAVKATLTQSLRNFEYGQEGLPEPFVKNLKDKLQFTLEERLVGIRIVRVLDLTDHSSDFERFRSVERELYASERELSYLQRTGEFRNRLEQEQNSQTINHTQNAEQLRQALQSINKDRLLNENEMEQFVMLLESQKRLREAKTKEEEYEALQDIKKSHILKDDEIASLQNTLEQNVINRENITQILRIQASQKVAMTQQIADFELSDSKMEHDMANALRQAQHQGNLAAAQLDTKRLMDAYDNERNEFDWNRAFSRRQQEDNYAFEQNKRQDEYNWQKQQREQQADNQQALFEQQMRQQQEEREHAFARQNKFDDMDILERKAAIAQANMRAMKEAELSELQEKNRSTESLASMQHNEQMNRDNNFANMSAEQIREAQLSHLSGDAQVAMAQSYSSEKENELRAQQQAEQKTLYEKMMQQQNAQNAQNQQMMMQMAQMMQQGMMGVSQQQMNAQQQIFQQQQTLQQQRYDEQVQMKQEYRDNMMHQQNRMDQTMDASLSNIGQVSTAAAGNINAYNGGTHQQRICPSCGATVPEGEMFCSECGQKMV